MQERQRVQRVARLSKVANSSVVCSDQACANRCNVLPGIFAMTGVFAISLHASA